MIDLLEVDGLCIHSLDNDNICCKETHGKSKAGERSAQSMFAPPSYLPSTKAVLPVHLCSTLTLYYRNLVPSLAYCLLKGYLTCSSCLSSYNATSYLSTSHYMRSSKNTNFQDYHNHRKPFYTPLERNTRDGARIVILCAIASFSNTARAR